MAAMGYAEPTVRLARALAATLPDPIDSVFFMNSGSEAIEAALKLARRVTGRPGIVAFRGGFHGRTLGATSITSSNPNYRQGYEPLLPSVYLSQFPSVYRDFGGDEERAVEVAFRHLRDLFHSTISPDEVAAIVIEPVQGEGGYVPAPPAFLQILRRVCDRHGILLVADEVQAGFGRTGTDVVVRARRDRPRRRLHGEGDRERPAALRDRQLAGRSRSAGARAPTARRSAGTRSPAPPASRCSRRSGERDLVANAAARGAELTAGLREIAARDARIGDVRGPGLMIGVEFVKDRATREPDGATCEAVIQGCADEGLLVLSCGVEHNVIRWIAAARRHGRGDRRGARDLPGGARLDARRRSRGALGTRGASAGAAASQAVGRRGTAAVRRPGGRSARGTS